MIVSYARTQVLDRTLLLRISATGDWLTARELSLEPVAFSVFGSDQRNHNQPVDSAGNYQLESMNAGGQAPKSQGIVCGLASDLWARIFSCLEDPNECLGYVNLEQQEQEEAEHAAFFELRLVCKAFNQIFADYHPCLTRSLTLRWSLAHSHVPSLMSWLHDCMALKRLIMLCPADFTEIVLAKLSFSVAPEIVQILRAGPACIMQQDASDVAIVSWAICVSFWASRIDSWATCLHPSSALKV